MLNEAFAAAARPGAALHLMGLVSDGGVHSSNEHLYALARAAKAAGASHIVVHCFMDGRDVPPRSGAGYLDELEGVLAELTDEGCTAEIGSISGRYAMDRDNRWERVEQAWRAVVAAEPRADATAAEVMAASYAADVTDEFVVPTALTGRGVRDGDAVVFFNFRPDRAREITRALVDPAFAGFERGACPQVSFVCLTEYDPEIPAPVAYPKEFPADVLADVLAEAGLAQYHIAETEKYAHVTFFLNGGREEPKAGEERALIPSPKVATYDLKPEMSEPDVAATLAAAIDAGEADVYIVELREPRHGGAYGRHPGRRGRHRGGGCGRVPGAGRSRAQAARRSSRPTTATPIRCSARTAAPSRLIPRRLCRSRSWTSRKRGARSTVGSARSATSRPRCSSSSASKPLPP